MNYKTVVFSNPGVIDSWVRRQYHEKKWWTVEELIEDFAKRDPHFMDELAKARSILAKKVAEAAVCYAIQRSREHT